MAASLTAPARRRGRVVAAMVTLGFGVAATGLGLSMASRGSAASMSLGSIRLASLHPASPDSGAAPADSGASSFVEVVLGYAELKNSPSVDAGAQLSLPISFGQPLAPEDEVPPRKRHWHRHVAAHHHRRGTYFLPAPTQDTVFYTVTAGTPDATTQEPDDSGSADSFTGTMAP